MCRYVQDCTADEYEKRLSEFDGVIAGEAKEAAAEGMVLRFVGKVDVVAKTGSVELAKFPSTHPFAGLQGADNIIEVQTMRYSDEMESTPLIIRGPGAGRAALVHFPVLSIHTTAHISMYAAFDSFFFFFFYFPPQ